MSTKELIELIRKMAEHQGVDPDLAVAIAGVESNYNASATRFEPRWKYFLKPEEYAKALEISVDTERNAQATSFSCMQIMGAVARELGYQGFLALLVLPEIGTLFAMKKLKAVCKKYPIEADAISSWNQGYPAKKNNIYLNDTYVQNVSTRLKTLRKI